MKVLRENLVAQFAVISFATMAILAGSLAILLHGGLSRNIELLRNHGAAMIAGTIIEDTDPMSIARITGAVHDLQWDTIFVVAGSFVILFVILITIVWRGGRTITDQRLQLESFNTHLEAEVERRTSELQRSNNELNQALMDVRSAQDQLIQAAKLAAVGELVAGVAHELNNPLAVISGYCELILLDQDVDETTKESVKLVHEQSGRCSRIVKNLLSFAHPSTDEKGEMSINASVEMVLQLRRHQLNLSNIELDVDLEPDLAPSIADTQQIEQVILNLVVNAEQAMTAARGGGKLKIRTKQEDNRVLIQVSDDGPGIPSENLRRIFDPFFTTKAVGKGTGLGLSLCHSIIQDHGGHISVESGPVGGTTFTVEMPTAQHTASTPETGNRDLQR